MGGQEQWLKQWRPPQKHSWNFPDLLFCFRSSSSLTNSTQFGNDSNYSKFNGENIATNCSRVTVLALDGLTNKHFGHYILLEFFPSDHQVRLAFDISKLVNISRFNSFEILCPIDLFLMLSCIATRWLVHNDRYIEKQLWLLKWFETLWFGRLHAVTT